MRKKFGVPVSLSLTAVTLLTAYLVVSKSVFAADKPGAHEDHAEHAEGKTISLTQEQIAANGIEIAEAGPGEITVQITLPGEIKLNADRVAHVVPRVAGVVREVFKNAGDRVAKGEIMAILDSRELAMMKAAYLAARERESLARSIFEREKGLWEKKISAEQDFLAAKQALAEAAINTRSTEQQLHAIGCSEEYIASLSSQEHVALTRYEITAPFEGVVIEKHITLGESLKDDISCFTVADLRTVWLDLSVYQKDIPAIAKGQEVWVMEESTPPEGVRGPIEYIGPVMGEDTRTVIARAVIPNNNGRWRPGQFVTGTIATERQSVSVCVPKTAIQTLEKVPCLFVRTEKGFEAVPVTLGRGNEKQVEILSGLAAGQPYVVVGSFILKAMLEKGEVHDDH